MTILWESACGCNSHCPCGRRVAELELEVLFWRTGLEESPVWKAQTLEMHAKAYAMLRRLKEARTTDERIAILNASRSRAAERASRKVTP